MTMWHTRTRPPRAFSNIDRYGRTIASITNIAAKYYHGREGSLTAIFVILSICEAYINTDLTFSFEFIFKTLNHTMYDVALFIYNKLSMIKS